MADDAVYRFPSLLNFDGKTVLVRVQLAWTRYRNGGITIAMGGCACILHYLLTRAASKFIDDEINIPAKETFIAVSAEYACASNTDGGSCCSESTSRTQRRNRRQVDTETPLDLQALCIAAGVQARLRSQRRKLDYRANLRAISPRRHN